MIGSKNLIFLLLQERENSLIIIF